MENEAEPLKKRVRQLLHKAMEKNKKRPYHIVNNTDHNKDYVSKILNHDCNLSLDTAENIFKAVGFHIHITLKPLSNKSF